MAGIFVLIALIGAIVGAMARRRARERAILERAARAHASSWLLDPKILGVAMQAGRSLGWQRIVPIALLASWRRNGRANTASAGLRTRLKLAAISAEMHPRPA